MKRKRKRTRKEKAEMRTIGTAQEEIGKRFKRE
jgi:hypothetical protein